jgi:hypothetical protein
MMNDDRGWIKPGVIAWEMIDFGMCDGPDDLSDLRESEGRVVIIATDRGLATVDTDGEYSATTVDVTDSISYEAGSVRARLIDDDTALFPDFAGMVREGIRKEREYAAQRVAIADTLEMFLRGEIPT